MLPNRLFAITLHDLIYLIDSSCTVTLNMQTHPELKKNMTEDRLKEIVSLKFVKEIHEGDSVNVSAILEDREVQEKQEETTVH